jgi:hypothetical protein
MSGQDEDDHDRNFLARWSQRKQQAKQLEHDAPVAKADVPPSPTAEGDVPQEFDLSSLPKLEELTSTTDITAFLRKGVPEHLRNAALRKSWALDPAIRNYVNPALEYAYDWNTPGGVPGNSEIEAGMDVARLVSQIMGSGEAAAEAQTAVVEPAAEPGALAQLPVDHAAQESAPELPSQAVRLGGDTPSMAQKSGIETAQTVDSGADSVAPQQRVRRHGSAKPAD